MIKSPLHHSDHVLVEAELPVNWVNIKSKTCYNFAKVNFEGMRIKFSNIEIEYENDVDKIWRNF